MALNRYERDYIERRRVAAAEAELRQLWPLGPPTTPRETLAYLADMYAIGRRLLDKPWR